MSLKSCEPPPAGSLSRKRKKINVRKDRQVPAPADPDRSSDRGLLAAWAGMYALVTMLSLLLLGAEYGGILMACVGVVCVAMFLTRGRGGRGR